MWKWGTADAQAVHTGKGTGLTLQQRLPSRWALRSSVPSGPLAMTRYACWGSWRASTSSSASSPGPSWTKTGARSRSMLGRMTGSTRWSNCCRGTRAVWKSLGRPMTFTAQGYCGACRAGHRSAHCLDRWTDRHQPPRRHRKSPRSRLRHPRAPVRLGGGQGLPRTADLARSAAEPATAGRRALRGPIAPGGLPGEGARGCPIREGAGRGHGGAA